MRTRAVVTGIGLISPLGFGVDTFWPAALAGQTACAPIPSHWRTYCQTSSTIWAPLPHFDVTPYGVSRIETTQLDRFEQLAIACARMALDSAGLSYELRDPKKNTYVLTGADRHTTGVFMGTGVGGAVTLGNTVAYHVATPAAQALETIQSDLGAQQPEIVAALAAIRTGLRLPSRLNPFSVPMVMPNGASATIGIKYGLHGRNTTVAGACASGTIAVGQALRAVQSGEMPVALAGGVDYLNDEWGTVFRAFDIVQTLVKAGDHPETANRPFDTARSGFLFAEGGGAVLVIEALDHALARQAPIVAELAGYAETFDAHSLMMLEPTGTHLERMVRNAIADAGVTAKDIGYINAHGTGTVLNDETETAMLARVFGDTPAVNSTKALVGHTIGGSGAIEAAVTALSLRDQTTHVCANLESPIHGLRYVREPGPVPMTVAVSESFAFGGHNAAIVMRRYSA